MCADEVQILVPLISQPPSVLVALVLAANRSEPEFGSLMPIEKKNSPRQTGRREKRRAGAGPTRTPWVTTEPPRKRRSCPPYFFGQVMPSQPRSPTRRENSGASLSSRWGLCGSKVPAAISSARKARTCLRSTSHSGGRRVGSKRRAAVILNLVSDEDVHVEVH